MLKLWVICIHLAILAHCFPHKLSLVVSPSGHPCTALVALVFKRHVHGVVVQQCNARNAKPRPHVSGTINYFGTAHLIDLPKGETQQVSGTFSNKPQLHLSQNERAARNSAFQLLLPVGFQFAPQKQRSSSSTHLPIGQAAANAGSGLRS